MEDFEAALNSLLSDPNAMSQIMDLAGRLGATPPPPPSREDATDGDTPPPPDREADARQIAQLTRLLSLFRNGTQPDGETAALLSALRPFLREERRRKLDKAVHLAGLSQAATEAYRLWKEGELHF